MPITHTVFFSGCRLPHGLKGAIFDTGLDEQCKEVIDAVLYPVYGESPSL